MYSPASHRPFERLVPLFSKSKIDGYGDILIPLIQPGDEIRDLNRGFQTRADTLYWRGPFMNNTIGSHQWEVHAEPTVLRQALHGHHQHRLLHLVHNTTRADMITVAVPVPGRKNKFTYERVPATELNSALPFEIGFTPTAPACQDLDCEVATRKFGTREPPDTFNHRYVMILDHDLGPSPDTIRAIRSESVPFVATIFREWYTERILPWVHFVPIDIRFQALHSSLAYFTGLKDRGKLNGREVDMPGGHDDAKWIASQGKSWAKKALRKEDMEIYLFRLLLEWGRVIDDDRDKMGFKLKDGAT
jgi:hypothetical protein